MRIRYSQVMRGGIKFVTDGGVNPPAYNISVTDSSMTIPSSAAIINFTPKPQDTSAQNDPVRNAIIGGVVSGVVGLGFFAVKAYLERRAAKSLKQVLEGGQTEMEKRLISFQREVIRPVADKVFTYIKTTNLIGFRSEKETRSYVAAIETLLGKLADLGVNLNLQTLQAAQQNRLFTEIAKQTRLQLVPNYGFCSCAYFASFFKPEISPQQIEENADIIAAAVQAAMRSSSQALTAKQVQRGSTEPTEMQEMGTSLTVDG